jgi:hypothetical protein
MAPSTLHQMTLGLLLLLPAAVTARAAAEKPNIVRETCCMCVAASGWITY